MVGAHDPPDPTHFPPWKEKYRFKLSTLSTLSYVTLTIQEKIIIYSSKIK